MNPILAQALALEAAGVSVVPVRADGSKAPAGQWKQYQEQRATPEQIRHWFDPAANGPAHEALGIITGAISGNLEMAEIEGRAAHLIPQIQETAYSSGLGPVWEKVCQGWLEESPSGGMHWFYRLEETPAGNTKIARRPSTPDELQENPGEKWKVLTETRGEGGFVVVAPTGGAAHPTGKPWEVVVGGPATVPTLTPEEHEQLHILLASIGEEPPAPPAPTRTSSPGTGGGLFGAVSPGDDYEEKTDWKDILVGWRFAFQDSTGERYWTRPGKKFGVSATTGKDPARDRLMVFTSSTDFETFTPYTKFGAYAHLNHGGDHSAAATALRRQGFGKDPEIGTSTWTPQTSPSPFAAPATAAGPSEWSPAGQPGTPAANPGSPASTPALSATPAEWASTPTSSPAEPTIGTEGNLATVTELRPRNARTIAFTDDGNAQLLISLYGRELRYNPDRARWLHWNGTVWEWQPAGGGVARELAKDTIRGMETDGNEAARTWKKKSLSAAAIANMLLQAQTDPRVTVDAKQLDAEAWELNTPDGIIDLRTGTMLPANPESLHTKQTAVTPDFKNRSPVFDDFLAQTFQGDQEKQDYVQRILGYAAVGEVRENILPLATGTGGNGKGVLFESVKAVLGDYATSAPEGFLMKTPFQSHPTDLAALFGARFVLSSETNQDDKFDEGKVKKLAGGDSITARFMRQDNFTFLPTHQILIMMNHRPAVEAGGPSFWRRARVIPFGNNVPEERQIPGLQKLLSSEEHGPAVLAWIAEGAAAYAAHGLHEPESVRQATNEYKREVDTVGRWLEAEATVEENADSFSTPTPTGAVINSYERWCRQEGATPLKGKNFTNALQDHGIVVDGVPRDYQKRRQYAGIILNTRSAHYGAEGGEQPEGSPFAAGQGRAW